MKACGPEFDLGLRNCQVCFSIRSTSTGSSRLTRFKNVVVDGIREMVVSDMQGRDVKDCGGQGHME